MRVWQYLHGHTSSDSDKENIDPEDPPQKIPSSPNQQQITTPVPFDLSMSVSEILCTSDDNFPAHFPLSATTGFTTNDAPKGDDQYMNLPNTSTMRSQILQQQQQHQNLLQGFILNRTITRKEPDDALISPRRFTSFSALCRVPSTPIKTGTRKTISSSRFWTRDERIQDHSLPSEPPLATNSAFARNFEGVSQSDVAAPESPVKPVMLHCEYPGGLYEDLAEAANIAKGKFNLRRGFDMDMQVDVPNTGAYMGGEEVCGRIALTRKKARRNVQNVNGEECTIARVALMLICCQGMCFLLLL